MKDDNIPPKGARISRCFRSIGFFFAPAALASCAAISPATHDTSGSGRGGQEVDIYYKSQASADIYLNRYAISHPTCEIWTNWRKVCSRSGDGGAVLCSNSEKQVEPSVPFCLAERGEPYRGLLPNVSPAERLSFNRFCVEYGDGVETSLEDCVRWRTDRPFNNLRLSELDHPWCNRWALSVSPNENPELSAERGYYCASRNIPSWCEWVDGLGIGPQDGASDLLNGSPKVFPTIDPASRAVNFPHCRRRLTSAQ